MTAKMNENGGGLLMKRRTWKERIKKACKDAGTYQTYFDNAIDTLAGILETRDNVEQKYIESGAQPVVQYTNKSGSTNLIRNPLLSTYDEMNKTALMYWKELGLTPSAYKKVTGDKPKNGKGGGLAAALAAIDS